MISPEDREQLLAVMTKVAGDLASKTAASISALEKQTTRIAEALEKLRADPEGVALPREEVAEDKKADAIEAANPRVIE
jgi:hypothetical protein